MISKTLKQSRVIKIYTSSSLGGYSIDVLILFTDEGKNLFTNELQEMKNNIILEANYERISRDVFIIKSPH